MRACLASYFSAARAPRIARAAARCFDSLFSCSSVRSSSCWIAPSVPTWYCIRCCRCLAIAGSLGETARRQVPNLRRTAGVRACRRHRKEAVTSMREMQGEAPSQVVTQLVRAIDMRDAYTARHSEAVGELARRVGMPLGLDRDDLWVLEQAARLHDIGKV